MKKTIFKDFDKSIKTDEKTKTDTVVVLSEEEKLKIEANRKQLEKNMYKNELIYYRYMGREFIKVVEEYIYSLSQTEGNAYISGGIHTLFYTIIGYCLELYDNVLDTFSITVFDLSMCSDYNLPSIDKDQEIRHTTWINSYEEHPVMCSICIKEISGKLYGTCIYLEQTFTNDENKQQPPIMNKYLCHLCCFNNVYGGAIDTLYKPFKQFEVELKNPTMALKYIKNKYYGDLNSKNIGALRSDGKDSDRKHPIYSVELDLTKKIMPSRNKTKNPKEKLKRNDGRILVSEMWAIVQIPDNKNKNDQYPTFVDALYHLSSYKQEQISSQLSKFSLYVHRERHMPALNPIMMPMMEIKSGIMTDMRPNPGMMPVIRPISPPPISNPIVGLPPSMHIGDIGSYDDVQSSSDWVVDPTNIGDILDTVRVPENDHKLSTDHKKIDKDSDSSDSDVPPEKTPPKKSDTRKDSKPTKSNKKSKHSKKNDLSFEPKSYSSKTPISHKKSSSRKKFSSCKKMDEP